MFVYEAALASWYEYQHQPIFKTILLLSLSLNQLDQQLAKWYGKRLDSGWITQAQQLGVRRLTHGVRAKKLV